MHNLLSDLAPGFFVTQLSLLVDRVYVRETITQVGDPPRDVKEWAGVELICWDDAVKVYFLFFFFARRFS